MRRSAFGGFAQLDQRKRRMETRLLLCGPHWSISRSLPMLLETLQTNWPPRSCRGSAEVFTGHVMQRPEVYTHLISVGSSSPGRHTGCLAGHHLSASFIMLIPSPPSSLWAAIDLRAALCPWPPTLLQFPPQFSNEPIIPLIGEVHLCSLDNNR